MSKRILVVSEYGSLYGPVSRIVGDMVGVSIEVEERLDIKFHGFPRVLDEWRQTPSKYDLAFIGYPHTEHTAIFVQQKTMAAKGVCEGFNVFVRRAGDELLLLADDSRSQAIEGALRLQPDLNRGDIKRALIIGEQSPAAAAAWACANFGIGDIEVFNTAGRTPSGDVPGTRGVKNPSGCYGLIINAMRPGGIGSGGVYDKCPISDEYLTPRTYAMDVVYNPRVTPFLKEATRRGCSVIGGLVIAGLRTLYGLEYLLPSLPDEHDFLQEVCNRVR